MIDGLPPHPLAHWNIRPRAPIGKRTVYGHVATTSGHAWGPIEIDDFGECPDAREFRCLRVSLGLGLRQAARALGLTPTQLSSVERGQCDADFAAMSDALRVEAAGGPP